MKYKCQYCGREFPTKAALSNHLHFCEDNPNKDVKKYICKYCGREFNSNFSLHNHENRCEKNPNRLIEEKYKCKYCGKYVSKQGLKYHEDRCIKNPNRINDARYKKEDVLNKIKENYPEIELPYFDKEYINTGSKITCKLGNNTFIYSCGNLYRGSINIGKLKRTNTLDKIKENYPGIELPYFDKEFNGTNSSLITVIYNGKTLTNIPCSLLYRGTHKLLGITKVKTPNDIYNEILNKYPGIELPNFFTECIEGKSCLKKKITCIYNENIFYNCSVAKLLGNDYKFSINNKNRKRNKKQIYDKILSIYPGIELPYFDKEYNENIDYSKNVVTVIYNGHKFINVNISKLCRKIYTLSIKDFNKKEKREEKLRLLTEYDLLSMDWSVILDLISEDKFPDEFRELCKFGPNTEGRKETIEKLKDKYNISADDEIEEVEYDENLENEVINIDDDIYNNEIEEENELKSYKEIDDIASLINLNDEEIYSTGDKYEHIYSKEISKLWSLVLRDDENHSTKNIEMIKNKVNDSSTTPFAKHIYGEFLSMYENVINLIVN